MKRIRKICLVTLGCPKNVVEGETIAGILQARGLTLTTDLNAADAALVHTCSFIAEARDESREVIERLSSLKQKGSLKKLIVSGCMVQDDGEKIVGQFPEADGFIGTGALERLPELLLSGRQCILAAPGGLLESKSPRLLSSAVKSAYLRLSEGCNHRCSFCVIPGLRGSYRSRSMESVLREAKSLRDQGVKELVLIAQDTSFYGTDRYQCLALPRLLIRLAAIDGIRWIRLLYAYPRTVTDELLEVMHSEAKICKYLDMPLQHAHDDVLRRMRRPLGVRRIVERIKKVVPGIALRTSFIVGFPGETGAEFRELCDFVSEGWFEHVGVFEYSDHPDAPSSRFPGRIGKALKEARRKSLMLRQQKVVAQHNAGRINSLLEVFVEQASRKDGSDQWADYVGRAEFQAPEIDSVVLFSGPASAGPFVRVRITGTRGYDLVGTIDLCQLSERAP